MRVAFVTDTFPPDLNGVALTMEQLRLGLEVRGHQVHVIRPASGSDPVPPPRRETRVRSLPVPGYPSLRFGLPSWGRLRRLWSRARPDVVYVATEGPLSYAATRLARRLGIPTISGFHTNFHEYLRVRHLAVLSGLVLRYLRLLHNGTAMTLAPSREMVAQLRACGFRNVEVLGRGVEAELFTPVRRDTLLRAAWGVRGVDEVVFLMVGRLAPEKNLPLALEALTRFRRDGARFQCVLVGDGPDRAKLERHFPFVHFAGARRGEDLARHYASADVLLFPSLTETFGNVLLEGLASGLLTLSFDYAAAGQYVVDGLNGWKVPFADDDSFVERAAAVLQCSPAARRGLGAAARRTAEALGWDRVIRRFEELLLGASGCPLTQASHSQPTTA
jgi:glycosyltransferase involved in cell wall biosynthesis